MKLICVRWPSTHNLLYMNQPLDDAQHLHTINGQRAMRLVWRLALATTLIVIAFAATTPVLAVLLQQQGFSTSAVGSCA
jgi:hypothetical protein